MQKEHELGPQEEYVVAWKCGCGHRNEAHEQGCAACGRPMVDGRQIIRNTRTGEEYRL